MFKFTLQGGRTQAALGGCQFPGMEYVRQEKGMKKSLFSKVTDERARNDWGKQLLLRLRDKGKEYNLNKIK